MPAGRSTDAGGPFDLDAFLPYQIAVIASRTNRDFTRIHTRELGLATAEWRVLVHLARAARVSVREIHLHVDLDKPKVSRAASRLEAAGYVAKRRSSTDRRLVELSLTEDGEAVMRRFAASAVAYQAELVDRLGSDSVAAIAALFRKLMADGDVRGADIPALD
ncbi:MAG: MarR family winged helix-turn-helix transcriptional regulator [Pseudomonadota bacterium]